MARNCHRTVNKSIISNGNCTSTATAYLKSSNAFVILLCWHERFEVTPMQSGLKAKLHLHMHDFVSISKYRGIRIQHRCTYMVKWINHGLTSLNDVRYWLKDCVFTKFLSLVYLNVRDMTCSKAANTCFVFVLQAKLLNINYFLNTLMLLIQ